MNILSKIEAANYVASEQDVEALALSHLTTSEETKRIDGSYLRILVTAAQAQFGGPKHKGPKRRAPTKPELDTHAQHVAEIHGRLYPAVVRGITTPEVADTDTLTPDERRSRAAIRNSRAGFARSAASTLQSFIKAGGDVRALDAHTLTKSGLRTWVQKTKGPTPHTALIDAALTRIERQALSLLEEDATEGQEAIEKCIARLQSLLDRPVIAQRVGVESGVFQRARGPTFKRTAAPA